VEELLSSKERERETGLANQEQRVMTASIASNCSSIRQRREMFGASTTRGNGKKCMSMSLCLFSLMMVPLLLASCTAESTSTKAKAQVRSKYGVKERGSDDRSLQTTFVTNFSEDGEGAVPKHRVPITTFSISMTPSPYELDMEGQDEFHRLLELVILDYMSAAQVATVDFAELELEYVLLGDMQSVYTPPGRNRLLQGSTLDMPTDTMSGGTTTLTLESGVASFLGGGETPSESQVNTWVREAIDTQLVNYLQDQDTDFYYVGESTFVPFPTPNIQPEDATTSDSNNVGMLVGVVVACVVGVALFGLLAVRHRQQSGGMIFDQELDGNDDEYNIKPVDRSGGDADTVNNDSYEAEFSSSPTRQRSSQGTGTQIATVTEDKHETDSGSVSEWTVLSEAGDSTALKTISTQQMMVVVPAMVNSESFERERPVNLRKDMLTSAWSGRANAARTNHNESVLQPSHFTASAERRVRRQEEDNDVTVDSDPSDDANGNNASPSPFVFEQAHESPSVGEEIYLMPSSQVNNINNSNSANNNNKRKSPPDLL
jgi:hypothetical protein